MEQFAFRGIPNLASPRIPKQDEIEDEVPPSIKPEEEECSKEQVKNATSLKKTLICQKVYQVNNLK